MTSLKTAVVGYGYWGKNIARVVSESEQFSLDIVCDSNESARRRAAKIHPHSRQISNLKEIPNDIAVVAIVTPADSHYSLARYFLSQGKHVLLAKPFASSLAEAEELAVIAKKSGRTIFVDHTFVFHPAVRKLKELLGRIGTPYFVLSQRLNLGLYQSDVNVIYDLMPHDLSILAYLFDDAIRPTNVQAIAAAGLPKEDLAHCSFEMANGPRGLVTVSWLSPSKIRQFIIVGSRGILSYDDVEVTEKVKFYDRGVDFDLTNVESLAAYTSRISYRTGDLYSPAIPNTEALSFELQEFHRAILDPNVREEYQQISLNTMVGLERVVRMSIKA
jgi:predicted dehydrogenase